MSSVRMSNAKDGVDGCLDLSAAVIKLLDSYEQDSNVEQAKQYLEAARQDLVKARNHVSRLGDRPTQRGRVVRDSAA